MPRPSPWSPACRPQLTPGRKCAPSSPLSSPLHRAALFSLAWLFYWWSAMPLACCPWLMCLPWATFINVVRVFEFRSRGFQKIQQCKFTVWKKLTVGWTVVNGWIRKLVRFECSKDPYTCQNWYELLQSYLVTSISVYWTGFHVAEKISCQTLVPLSLSQYWFWLFF